MTSFKDLLNGPARIDSNIVSENHDLNQINFGGDGAIEKQLRESFQVWDAAEFGMTREQALERLRQAETPEGRERVIQELRERALQRANLAVGTDGRVNVFVAGEPAWHTLGVNVREAVDYLQALRLSGLDGWGLYKEQLQTPDGLPVDRWAIRRSDNGVVLGTVGARYHVFDNEAAFDFLENVSEGLQYVSAGALGKGERVWMAAKLPQDARVAGFDPLESYLVLTAAHDGSGTVDPLLTTMRPECGNTLRNCMMGAKVKLALRHTKNIRNKVDRVQRMLGMSTRATERFYDVANTLARTTADAQTVRSYFQTVIDRTSQSTVNGKVVRSDTVQTIRDSFAELRSDVRAVEEKRLERAIRGQQSLFQELCERHDGPRNERIRGSLWGTLNSVTEYADHSPSVIYRGEGREREERRFVSTLEGRADEIKQTALAVATEFASN